MMTLKEVEIAERDLESQFNAAGSAMLQSEYLRRARELHEAKQEALRSPEEPKPAQPSMSAGRVTKICGDLFLKIMPSITDKFAAMEKRLDELERASGIAAMSRSIQNVERTLNAPVVPVFDSRGKLIAAKREIPADDSELADRLSLLEHRAQRHSEHLKSLERKSKDGR